MKRLFLIWELVLILILSGCGSPESNVETLKNWSFQYNESIMITAFSLAWKTQTKIPYQSELILILGS